MQASRTFVIALLALWPATVVAQGSAENFFPMEKGTYWIYEGTVKWSESQNEVSVIKTRKLRWKMEVVESSHKGDVRAALMKGHPGDLAWYEEGTQPGDYLLVRNGNRFFFLHAEDAKDGYRDLVNSGKLPGERNIFFAWPLKRGRHFCDPEQHESPDGSYCWSVNDIQSVQLRKMPVKPHAYRQYELALRTRPDHEIDYLVSGIGITKWIYSHHGSVSDVDVHLVEFHRGTVTGQSWDQ